MEFIANNWAMLLLVAILVANIIYDIVHFSNLPNAQKVEKIKGWLLQAVILAEKEFGSGTGALKLSVVYSRFCEQLPWLAQAISFETFSSYVDEVLVRMREMLSQNKNIATVVSNVPENGGEDNA